MSKPIIFLDVHGVLTNATSKFVYGSKDKLDPVSVRLVEKLAEECDAVILLTSSITQGLSERELLAKLVDIGAKRLIPYIIGAVPTPAGDTRGATIDRNLSVNNRPDYVILDDKPQEFYKDQRLVAIDPYDGFKLQYYEAAAKHLCPSTI